MNETWVLREDTLSREKWETIWQRADSACADTYLSSELIDDTRIAVKRLRLREKRLESLVSLLRTGELPNKRSRRMERFLSSTLVFARERK